MSYTISKLCHHQVSYTNILGLSEFLAFFLLFNKGSMGSPMLSWYLGLICNALLGHRLVELLGSEELQVSEWLRSSISLSESLTMIVN